MRGVLDGEEVGLGLIPGYRLETVVLELPDSTYTPFQLKRSDIADSVLSGSKLTASMLAA